MPTENEIRYELMRPQDLVAARERAPIAYVPIGPMEWHGPHMAVGMDMLHAQTMALEAARKAGGVVLPPLPLGTETYTDEERLRHRGTDRAAVAECRKLDGAERRRDEMLALALRNARLLRQ